MFNISDSGLHASSKAVFSIVNDQAATKLNTIVKPWSLDIELPSRTSHDKFCHDDKGAPPPLVGNCIAQVSFRTACKTLIGVEGSLLGN